MSRFAGKVALVTGAARGQGRSHAVRLAAEGADVAAVDICAQIPSVAYDLATPADLDETAAAVEKEGGRALRIQVDVRDRAAVESAVARTTAELGGLDLVVANAGVLPTQGERANSFDAWHAAIDVMLSGVFYTVYAATTAMLDTGTKGNLVITASTSSFRPVAYDRRTLNPGQLGYGAAKHGVVSLVQNVAMALGRDGIRINAVAPMGVRTPMIVNEHFAAQHEHAPPGWMANVMGVDMIEPADVSDAVLWLLSDQARYVTGTVVPIDAGLLLA